MTVWDTVVGWFQDIVDGITDAFSGIWEDISGAFKKVYEKIKEWIQKAVDFVKQAANTIKNALSVKGSIDVSKYSSGGGSVNVHAHAVGGVVEKGEIALLEGTGAEAVVPLDRNQKWIHAVAQDMANAGIGGGQTGYGSKFVTVLAPAP